MENAEKKGEVVIYRTADGSASLEVRLGEDTVWLSLNQMADLFLRDKSVVSRHLHNVFREKELSRTSTVAKFATVQKERRRLVQRDIEYYNLDVIISVGYRVKSKRGTQFRIWATNVLRDHIVKGFTLNQKRLQEQKQEQLKELEAAVALVKGAQTAKALTGVEAAGLLTVITEYTRSWLLLHQYDTGKLPTRNLNRNVVYQITEEEAGKAIATLKSTLMKRNQASDLFGRESQRGKLRGILTGINQTFGGKELYPTVEEKAAHLLYFLIKDHPFADGNKRTASLFFVWFLERNGALYTPEGKRVFDDNALVALALLVAESNPKQKDLMITLIINLIRHVR